MISGSLDEGLARKGLDDNECEEANHGCATIHQLSLQVGQYTAKVRWVTM